MFFIINELPYKLRFLPHNVIFGGLWFGETKPNFNTFLQPLVPIFQKIKEGITVFCNQSFIKVRGLLLNGIGDMPARSLMYNMTNFNGAYGCMKCLIRGIVKRLLELWTSVEFRSEPFSIYSKIKLLEERLTKLKPPHFVTRPPRSIQHCLAILKSSEFKNFLFYYSIPVLIGILPEIYLKHFILLVEAASLLHEDSISDEDLGKAKALIDKFVSEFEHLYGLRHMSANLHSLLHLPEAVQNTGPLWVNSCFPLEDLNGKLARLVHATKTPEGQICESFFVQQKLALYESQMANDS
ncbi:hypothetical protein B566_EDAN011282, partial [Ephemera danica]